jgi:hypothetical protein
MFIIVNSASVTGDTGIIRLGTDVLLPTNSRSIKLCCCVADGTFSGATSGWQFKAWSNFVCS